MDVMEQPFVLPVIKTEPTEDIKPDLHVVDSASLNCKQERINICDVVKSEVIADVKSEVVSKNPSLSDYTLKPCSIILDPLEINQYYCQHSGTYLASKSSTSAASNSNHNIWTVPYKEEPQIEDSVQVAKLQLEKLQDSIDKRSNVKHPKCICKICGKQVSPNYLKSHYYHVHKDSYQCKICNCQFNSVHYLKMHHLKEHLKQSCIYICHFCNNSYKTKLSLEVHIKNMHLFNIESNKLNIQNNVKFSCKICNKKLCDKATLQKHIERIHLKIKSISCGECDKKFFLVSDLRRHVSSTHLHQKPFKCDICNDKSYTRKFSLVEHINAHHNKLPSFTCKICTKRFFCPQKFKKHISNSHKRYYLENKKQYRPNKKCIYTCKFCEKKYNCIKSYNLHLGTVHKISTGIGSYCCEDCFRKFKTEIKLRNHREILHVNCYCHICKKCTIGKHFMRCHILMCHLKLQRKDIRKIKENKK